MTAVPASPPVTVLDLADRVPIAIRRRMLVIGTTTTDTAAALGVRRSWLYRRLTIPSLITVADLVAIAAVLRTSAADLLADAETMDLPA